jgi:hypothetical protein
MSVIANPSFHSIAMQSVASNFSINKLSFRLGRHQWMSALTSLCSMLYDDSRH